MRYDVYLRCPNGRFSLFALRDMSEQEVIQKVRDILKDNEGGVAEITASFSDFYTIVEY